MPGLLGSSRVTFETSAGHAFLLELATPSICLGVGRITDAIFGVDPHGGLGVAVVSGELDQGNCSIAGHVHGLCRGGAANRSRSGLGGRYLRREKVRRSCANDGNSIGVRHGVFSRETEIVTTEANIDPGDSPVCALAHFE